MATQQIIWKYETPLEGKYLAAYGYGQIKPGLLAPIKTRWSASTLYVSPFQVFLEPTNPDASGLMVKVYQTAEVSIEITNPKALALGITYEWTNDTSVEAQFEVLTTLEAVRSYTGVILCLLDYDNKKTKNLSADFTDVYWLQQGLTGVFLRRTLPRDVAYNQNVFQISKFSCLATDYNVTIQYAVGSDTILSVREAILTIDLTGYTVGNYILVGYQREFPTKDAVPDKIPLKVLMEANSIDALSTTIRHTVVAVMKWTGDNESSPVFQIIGTNSGSKQVTSTFSQEASDLTIHEGKYFRFFITPETFLQQYREDLAQSWDSSEEVARISDNLLGLRYHVSNKELFLGTGSREYADQYKAAIGFSPITSEDDEAYWWHCNSISNGKLDERLNRTNVTIFPDAVLYSNGTKFDIPSGDIQVSSPVVDNNYYWNKATKFITSKVKSVINLIQLLPNLANLFIDFWIMPLEEKINVFRLVGKVPGSSLELASSETSNILYSDIGYQEGTVSEILPDGFAWVENGSTYELKKKAITIYLYAPDGITETRTVYFKNISGYPVRVNLTQTQFRDIANGSFVSIQYVPTSNPEEHEIRIIGLLEYTKPSPTEQSIVDLASGRTWNIKDVYKGNPVPYSTVPPKIFGLLDNNPSNPDNSVSLGDFKVGKWYHITLKIKGIKQADSFKVTKVIFFINGAKYGLTPDLE